MKDMVRCDKGKLDFQEIGNPLYNILIALSNQMPEIGYGQGMSFLGELILFALLEIDHNYDEQLAFWIFLYIMDVHEYKGLFQYPF